MALTAKGFLVGESPTLPEKVCIMHFPLCISYLYLFYYCHLSSTVLDVLGVEFDLWGSVSVQENTWQMSVTGYWV